LLDSFGSRTWVDHDQAASFVAGVLTAFRDKIGPDSRYHDAASKEKIRLVALNMVRVNIERQENVRGLVRAVTSLSTYDECRALAAKRLVVGGWVQDPNLARQVKDLFEALCTRTALDTAFDLEALRYLLSPALSSMSQSYLSEHRTRLFSNNPSYPIQALSIALLDNFVAETVRLALAALPNEQSRARQAGMLFYKFCLNKAVADPADLVTKLLTAYPRLQRLDLCMGLLQDGNQLSGEEVARIEATYRAIVSWQVSGELSDVARATISDIMAVAARWGANISVETLHKMLFLSASDLSSPFSSIAATDGVLDPVSAGLMSSARLALLAALVMRSARFGQLKLSAAFAPVFVQRVMVHNVNDLWTSALIVAVAAVLCGVPAAGAAAIQFPEVRKLIMMLVTRRFVANVPTNVLNQLQGIPALPQLAIKSRDPDFVVMTLQEDPDAMQSAPLWLPQLLASGDASFLNGLPVEAALKTLLAATRGGPGSPLFAHVALLATKIDLKNEAVAGPFIQQLVQVGGAERASACAALAHCQGDFSAVRSMELFQRAIEVETDAKRLLLLLQRCNLDASGVSSVAESVVKTLSRRIGLRKCLASSPELQVILLRLLVSANAEGDALIALLPHESRLTPEAVALKAKVRKTRVVESTLSFKSTAPIPQTVDSSWWLKGDNGGDDRLKKQEQHAHPLTARARLEPVPKSVDWNSHPGVMADLASPQQPPQIPRTGSVIPPVSSEARNAVLCIINNSPLASLACKVLLRFPPDDVASTALMQFAATARPLNLDAMLVACASASCESVAAALDTLLSLSLNNSHEKRVRLFVQKVLTTPRLSKWAVDHVDSFCKLLATRGGMSWEDAERQCALFGVDQVELINHNGLVARAVGLLQTDNAAARLDAYETIFWSLCSCCEDVKELVLREWRLACVSVNLGVVTDAVSSAAVLHLLLGSEAGVREWLVKTHGPRSAADALRVTLIAKGFASF
jgi:hypothetical protein